MRSFMRLMVRKKVDFPQPEGPISAVIRWAAMSRLMFFRARVSP